MANSNVPFGLMPVEALGDMAGPALHRYHIASTDSSAYFVGSPVILAASADARGVPDVAIGAAAGVYVGAVVAIEPDVKNTTSMVATPLDRTQTSIPATKARDYYVLVSDDPRQIYEVQCGSVATNLVSTKLNNNFDLTITNPSVVTMPQSATVVNNASIATTNTLSMKMMGLSQRENNAIGAFQVVRCKINTHAYGPVIAGV